MKELSKELFKLLPLEYRGAPFWSINDKLDPEEVRRQVCLMVEAGFGGAFFHAREGLVTPFLGNEWFRAFEAAVDEARRLGATIWIYDELRWPSGFAGGIVPAKSAQYRARALVAALSERAFEGENVVAAFRLKLDERGLPVSYERAEPGEVDRAPLYLTLFEYLAQPGETWFESLCYVDLLDPDAVEAFIKAAYEPYLRYKEDFGKLIPGVFTDEPNLEASRPYFHFRAQLPPAGPRFPALTAPWTLKLPERFAELNGYSILDKLPELFFNVGDYMKTRYDFWRTVTNTFVEAFSKQIYEWCGRHGLSFTGHYLAEDTLLSQLRSGGAVMPHYEYMHVPGIDHLGFQIWGSLLTAKQVASVANQLGKQRVLCETYGCTGNYPTLAERKWIGDFLYALGVNLLNHHLVPYSLRGRRKRDYGLNFHWAQPWWKYNGLIEDYFTRLSYVLSQGARVVNVLVVHPIGSAWALYSPLSEGRVAELDQALQRLLKALLALHVDFELGDETIMERHARVEGAKLRVGRVEYDAVVVPPCVTLASGTLKLLKQLVEAGGVAVFVERVPELVDGRPSPELAELARRARLASRAEAGELERALEGVPRPVAVEGDPDGAVLYHLRRVGEQLLLFLANTDRESSRALRVSVEGSWTPELWDALTGEVRELGARVERRRTWLELELSPIGSALVVLSLGEPSPLAAERKLARELSLGDEGWAVKKLDSNALVLDYCRVSFDGRAWSDLMPVCRAQREVARAGVGTKFALRFEFECAVDPRGRRLELVVESPHLYEVVVNGVLVREWGGSWLDPNFRTARVSHLLSRGVNVVEVSGVVGLEPELEPVYLVGDFSVECRPRGGSRLVEEEGVVSSRNLAEQGLPFYAGSVELRKAVEVKAPNGLRGARLKFTELNAALAEVYVNGVRAGVALLPPYEVDVTGLLKLGLNEVKVILVGTLRNLFGPLHYRGGDPLWTGPDTFCDWAHWTDEYVLKPFGFRELKLLLY